MHAILHAHLIPPCPHADLFGGLGRAWLGKQPLPQDEQEAIERHLRELDRLGEDLSSLDSALAQAAIGDPAVKRLPTVAGINLTVAVGLTAAIGDVSRFASPQKLISYVGLNPRVRQSGLGFAQHGRISKQGRAHARSMLVEAAWAAANAPGPLRAFFLRIRARRGHQIAAVAVARKLTVLCWHLLTKETDYLWARPALVANKLRSMELQAGMPAKKGNKRGPAYATTSKNSASARPRWHGRLSAPTNILSANGKPADHRHGARAPQRRSDDSGCAAELASSSSALRHAVARARQKYQTKRTEACRSHPWSGSCCGAGGENPCGPARRPRSRR